MTSISSPVRSLALCAAAFFLALSGARAEIVSHGTVPLQPVPVKVEVERGKSVEIPLNVYGAALEDVQYRIRPGPEHGTLSDVRMIDDARGFVTYRHSGEFGHDRDVFFYAAKSKAGVSAAVGVHIAIVDRPPKLATPRQAEFGDVLIGTGAAVRVKISNEGGSFARGEISVGSPFGIREPPSYSLGPGESAEFTVVCAPESAGEVHGTLRYSSDPAGATMLNAVAVPPYRVEPSELSLDLDRPTLVRSAELRIVNAADAEQTVEIAAGEGILAPELVRLPVGGSATVSVKTDPADLAEIDGELRLTGTGYTTSVAVKAPIVPAIVEVDERQLSFGVVKIGTAKTVDLKIRNRGGERAFVYADTAEPFAMAESSAELALEPREEKSLSISAQPTYPGDFRSPLRIKAFETDLRVMLSVHVPDRKSAPLPTEPPEQPEVALEKEERVVPLIRDARLAAVTKTSATVAWPAGDDDPGAQYRLEARILKTLPGARIEIRWIPFSKVTVEKVDTEMRATASGLTPGGAYFVRVAEIDPTGDVVRASNGIRAIPEASKGLRITPVKALLVVLVVVLALIARQRYQERKALESGED